MSSLSSWIASLIRSRATNPPVLASDARSATGRPAKKTNGSAPADHEWNTFDTGGVCPPACISGQRPSAYCAGDGRRIRIGMLNDKRKLSFLFRYLPARRPETENSVGMVIVLDGSGS